MRRSKSTSRIALLAVAASLFCFSSLQAKKPGTPGGGGGGGGPVYTLTDLLGFPDELGYQSQGMFITNRDGDDEVLVYGDSHWFTLREFHPALWRIAADGSFPDSDPLDLGLPEFGGEVTPTGLNNFGITVGHVNHAIEKDAQGKWVFPSYVDIPGLGFRELPSPVSRNTVATAINDRFEIVGIHRVPDVDDPDGLAQVGGLWQLNPFDGSIANPVDLGEFEPLDINHFGVMTGRYLGWPAIAWFDGASIEIRSLDSSLKFSGADPVALNNHPIDDPRLTVVGQSYRDETGDTAAPIRGFAWRPFDADNPTTVLGTLGGLESWPKDVNAAGDIVGWLDTSRHGQAAFIYSGGKMSNLNSMVDTGKNTLQWARAINDDGDITGFMRIPRPVSEQRGFLLRPINQN